MGSSAEKPVPDGGYEAPALGGVRAGPAIAVLLYALLLGSAALALSGRQFPGRVPTELAQASPWAFLAFAALFGVYRFALVRARKYPASKAFFQVGVALFFFVVLLRPVRSAAPRFEDSLETLMDSSDARVRALAAEVAGYRSGAARYAPLLTRALEDPDEAVRNQAHASLVRLAGTDMGPPGDAAALHAWKERFP